MIKDNPTRNPKPMSSRPVPEPTDHAAARATADAKADKTAAEHDAKAEAAAARHQSEHGGNPK